MDSRRAALIHEIRQWATDARDLLFVTVIGRRSVALFREDVAGATDAQIDALLDERLAAPATPTIHFHQEPV